MDTIARNDNGISLSSSLISLLWNIGTVVSGLVAVLGGLLYAKQDSLLYYPEIGGIPRRPGDNPAGYRSPEEHEVPFETHLITCEDGVRIHSWLILREQSEQHPTIVFFHGNAGNIGLRLPNALRMKQYLNVNVFLVEYRGYGDSDSVVPNEAGLKLDAEAALRFVVRHKAIDPTKIFLFGRSLGGAVAFHLARYAEKNKIHLAGVILENTFLSIAAMVDHLMPYVAPFKSLILRIGWRSSQIAPYLKTPLLYLAGSADNLVPHEHMLELHRRSKSSRMLQMHVILHGTHNESWIQGGEEYWAKIRSFIAEASSLPMKKLD